VRTDHRIAGYCIFGSHVLLLTNTSYRNENGRTVKPADQQPPHVQAAAQSL
jgi:hypothetical protein